MIAKPLRKSAGLLLLYDGFRALLSSADYRRSWQTGILTLDDMLDYIAERPDLTKKLAIFEISAGIWLTLR